MVYIWLLILPTAALGAAQTEAQQSAIKPSALQTSLAVFFATKPMLHGARAVFESIKAWPNMEGEARWSLPPLRFLSKRVSLIAEQGKGKSLRRWYVPVQLKWMMKTVVFSQDVSARAMLDSSMVSIELKNVAGLRGQLWSSKADVIGLKTLRGQRRGDVVLSTKVVRPPLIQRGDRVTILVSIGGLSVRAEGVALKSGSRGDRLLVQNIRSRQTLQSIVQDAHTVSVHLGGV